MRRSQGVALVTMIVVMVFVTIAALSVSIFIGSSVQRHDSHYLRLKALYLAQAGIHKAIYNIESTGSVGTVSGIDANNLISVETLGTKCNSIILKSTGTAISPSNPSIQISRSVSTEYNAISNQITWWEDNEYPLYSESGLVYHWRFDENGGITTGEGVYQGTLVGSPNWVAPAKVGTSGLDFNTGSHSYVTAPNSPGLQLTTAGTLSCWVYINSLASAEASFISMGNLTSGADWAYSLGYINDGANRRLALKIVDSSGHVTLEKSTSFKFQTNRWYYVVATWEVPTETRHMRVYVNGDVEHHNNSSATPRVSTGSLQIGTRYPDNSAYRLNGMIDDVRIFNRALCPGEIKYYYDMTK